MQGLDIWTIYIESLAGMDGTDELKGLLVKAKANTLANADFFRAEAEGIVAIRSTGKVRVPIIYARGKDSSFSFLLMEYIDSGKLQPDFGEKHGVNLASMHSAETAQYLSTGKYGFYNNNYIGAGKQKNTPKNSWIEFFSECRLRPQFEQAEEYFDSAIIKAVDKLLNNLDRFLFEPKRPSLLHGDLWSGNFMSDEMGMPVLIDPAVYVGCNEADIAMTELFGGFDRRFYDAYFDVMNMVPGYEERRNLYNLYHLTNHLNLFGNSYLPEVLRIIRWYT